MGRVVPAPPEHPRAVKSGGRGEHQQRWLHLKLRDGKSRAFSDVNTGESRDEVLNMHQRKYTPAGRRHYQQRNAAIAEGRVVRERTAYSKTLIQYEQATGTLLELMIVHSCFLQRGSSLEAPA